MSGIVIDDGQDADGDGSTDGGSTDDGDSTDSTQCPSGQVWDPRLQACVDSLGGGGDGGDDGGDTTTVKDVEIINIDANGDVQSATVHVALSNPNSFEVRCEVELTPDSKTISQSLKGGEKLAVEPVYRFNNEESMEQQFCATVITTQKV